MAKEKKVTLHMSRNFTLNRKDKEPVELKVGRNDNIDADVAEHPFVKHLITAEPLEDQSDRIADLEAAVAVANKRADEAEAKVADLEAALSAMSKPATATK